MPYKDPEKKREWQRLYQQSAKHREWMHNYQKRNSKTLTNNRLTRLSRIPEARLLKSARANAKARGTLFDLTVEDIIIPSHCPILGIPLIFTEKNPNHEQRHDNCPSIDRLIPAKGYVKGNVAVMSMRANRIKSDATVEELELIVEFLKRRAN